MRRGSLVGPLLLIGIGALFLARNVMPELPLLDYLAQYWPLLLILWGSLRLIEIATWAIRGKPLPAYGVSGGEWVLVIFLCMFGLSLHAVRGFSSWFPAAGIEWGGLEVFGESYDYPVSAEAPAPSNARVVIEGFRGTARFVGTDANTVKVTGRQTIRSVDQATADRASKDIGVDVTAEGDRVVIRVRQSESVLDNLGGKNRRGWFTRRVTADLDIAVPKGASLVAASRDGNIDVSALAGNVEINGDNSGVRLENIGGEVRLETSGSNLVRAVNLKSSFELKGRGNDIDLEKIAGNVTVSGSWSGLVQMRELAKPVRWNGLQTTMSFQALPGDLRLTTGDIAANRVTGPFRIDSQSKDIDISETSGSTTITLQRGDVRLAQTVLPVSEMSVRLESGNVELTLPDKGKFNLNAQTQSGEAYNDYGSDVRQQSEGRRGASLSSSMGGPSIDVRLSRGDITVRRSGSAVGMQSLPPKAAPASAPPSALVQ